jgi:capsular polysaccharide transport system permease protein
MDTMPPGPVPGPAPAGRARLPLQRLRVVTALVIREMGTKFGRSVGGYAWAIAEPLGGILLLSIAFSLALRTPPLGTSFMLFYATGIVPFYMFNTMARGVAGAISSNRGLLNYPVVSVIDAVFAKFVLNFLTIFIIATVLMASIILGYGLHVNLKPGALLLAFSLAALLGLGVGAMNCVLFGFFPTWRNVWAVLTRPLFILSGVFYLFESAPPVFQHVLWWNPLVHVIAVMRHGVYGQYDPAFVSYAYVIGVALTLFVTGAWLMRRHASFLIEQ